MKSCPKCEQENPDEARYCQQCGDAFGSAAATETDETALWRRFIGPNADRYLERFRAFASPEGPRFAMTWHWPAFLFEPFLWFLYRKLYLYAAVYALGPIVSFLMTKALAADVVWRVGAAVSANYVYFWHVKDRVARIRAHAGSRPEEADRLLAEEGGVQMYVFWLGVLLFSFKVAVIIAVVTGAVPPELLPIPPAK